MDELLAEKQREGGPDGIAPLRGAGFKRHKSEKVMIKKSVTECKPNNGLTTSSDRVIPGGLLLSIARFRFTR